MNTPYEYWYDGSKSYKMGWDNWCPGQPDNDPSAGVGLFSDVHFSSNNYCWNDGCNSCSMSYVCEKDKRKRNELHAY